LVASILQRIEADLKTALLSGDKKTAETLKTVKSSLQYEAVSQSRKLEELKDSDIEPVLQKEAKKRQEAAELYEKAGEQSRSDNERQEKAIIAKYLPQQKDESEISEAITEAISKIDNPSNADMGRIIGAVKAKFGSSADGAVIARLTKQQLEKK